MEPLLDIVKHYNLRKKIVDDFAYAHANGTLDIKELINAVDEMQLKLRENMFALVEI